MIGMKRYIWWSIAAIVQNNKKGINKKMNNN